MCPLLGTCPTTQACALTGNRTSNTLVHRPALNPLNHTIWGCCSWTLFFLYLLFHATANFVGTHSHSISREDDSGPWEAHSSRCSSAGSQCPAFLFTHSSSPLRPCCWAQSCFSVCPFENLTVNFPNLPSHWARVLTSASGVYFLGQNLPQSLLGPFHLLG